MPTRRQTLAGAAAIVGSVLAGCGNDGAEPAPPVEIRLDEWDIEGDLTVPAGRLVVTVVNVGFVEHNVGFEGGPFSRVFQPDERGVVDFGVLEPGEYVFYCDLDGHRAAGMETVLVVAI